MTLNQTEHIFYPEPTRNGHIMCRTADGNEVSGKQIGVWAKRAQQQQLKQEVTKEKWQCKLLKIRWEDDQLSRSCFDWLKEWKTGPSNTIAARRRALTQARMFMQNVRIVPGKRPSHLVRLQYFSTSTWRDTTQP